jgi:hypothetical protein
MHERQRKREGLAGTRVGNGDHIATREDARHHSTLHRSQVVKATPLERFEQAGMHSYGSQTRGHSFVVEGGGGGREDQRREEIV